MQVFATMSTPFISEEYNDTDDNFCKILKFCTLARFHALGGVHLFY